MNLFSLLPDRFKTAAISWSTNIRVYKIPVILGLFSCLCFLAALILIRSLVTSPQPIEITTTKQSDILDNTNIQLIVIDVKGAVNNSGVYKLPLGSRVSDAISAAGGLSTDADFSNIEKTINAAQKVSDGQKIYIPRINETSVNEMNNNIKSSINTSNNSFISINFSSATQLEALSGVGPATAEKIIANRPYSRLEELVEKKVLGEKLFTKIKDQLSL